MSDSVPPDMCDERQMLADADSVSSILFKMLASLNSDLFRPRLLDPTAQTSYFASTLWFELRAHTHRMNAHTLRGELNKYLSSTGRCMVEMVSKFRASGRCPEGEVKQVLSLVDTVESNVPSLKFMQEELNLGEREEYGQSLDGLRAWAYCSKIIKREVKALLMNDDSSCFLNDYLRINGGRGFMSCQTITRLYDTVPVLLETNNKFVGCWKEMNLPNFDTRVYELQMLPAACLVSHIKERIALIHSVSDCPSSVKELLPELWDLILAKADLCNAQKDRDVALPPNCVSIFSEAVDLYMSCMMDCLSQTVEEQRIVTVKANEALERIWLHHERLFRNMRIAFYDFSVSYCHMLSRITKNILTYMDGFEQSDKSFKVAKAMMLRLRPLLPLICDERNMLCAALLHPAIREKKGETEGVDLGDGWTAVPLEGAEVTAKAINDFLLKDLSTDDSAPAFTLFKSDRQTATTVFSDFFNCRIDPNVSYEFGSTTDADKRKPFTKASQQRIIELDRTLVAISQKLQNLADHEMSGDLEEIISWHAFVGNVSMKAIMLDNWLGTDDEFNSMIVTGIVKWLTLVMLQSQQDARVQRWMYSALDMLRRCIRMGVLNKMPLRLLRELQDLIARCIVKYNTTMAPQVTNGGKPTFATVSPLVNAAQTRDTDRDIVMQMHGIIGHVVKLEIGEVASPAQSEQFSRVWKKIGLLGSGSFGHVYEGIDIASGALIAVKEVPLSMAARNSSSYAEASILKRLRHPNIIEFYGMEREHDNLLLFTEFCAGGSLGKQLQMGPVQEERLLKNYAWQILQGLAYLHSNGIVHRDVKPDNILIDRVGCLKLADFGSFRVISAAASKSAHSLVGTPAYMAPEAITGSAAALSSSVTGKADIWSFGCTLLHLATGRRPWSQLDNEWAVLYTLGVAEDVPRVNEELMSRECAALIKCCLNRAPDKRPTAQELLIRHPFLTNPHSYKFSRTAY